MAFRVGQKVVCVSDMIIRMAEFVVQPRVGCIYTVRDVYRSLGNFDAIHLVEIKNGLHISGREFGFHAVRFRPVVERKTDISVFTKMLTDTKIGADI
jgi:hypothetical protein